jgi:hypothetical protein
MTSKVTDQAHTSSMLNFKQESIMIDLIIGNQVMVYNMIRVPVMKLL